MGTNYYVEDRSPCPTCQRPYEEERRHIGKSSAGWCFALHVIPEEGIRSLEDWQREWAGKRIVNEYGEEITEADMMKVITGREWKPFEGRKWGTWYADDEANFHRVNDSERGPNGLLRHRIGDHCVGHGDGTWDLIPGEFS